MTPTQEVACICGDLIQRVELPEEISETSGVDYIWVHIVDLNTQCYEDAPGYATPYLGSDFRLTSVS